MADNQMPKTKKIKRTSLNIISVGGELFIVDIVDATKEKHRAEEMQWRQSNYVDE